MTHKPLGQKALSHKSPELQKRGAKALAAGPAAIEIDAYRTLVFPNRIRKFRKQLNIGSLLELSEKLPAITYIRLSKIERGEIFARAGELRDIAGALGIDAEELLIDIDDADFDIAAWADPLHGGDRTDPEAERFAVLLAAALRRRRAADDTLTIAALEQEYGIAPVILSRIENALKPFERWNEEIRTSLRRLFAASDDAELFAIVNDAHMRGDLDAVLPMVANPQLRITKSRNRIAALRNELSAAPREDLESPAPTGTGGLRAAPGERGASRRTALERPLLDQPLGKRAAPSPAVSAEEIAAQHAPLHLVPVYGSPLPDGLIARTPAGTQVEAPRSSGPRTYGLRLGRPTLGAGLPGRSILLVDPDRFPSAGGLAVVTEEQGLRVLSVTLDRQGRMLGYSENPDLEIAIDEIDPVNLGTVVAALFE
ncbi:MAG: family transcriptional regulator [Novosphingobium lindaniclasticum]|jgi:transcriptional regulator with XRE-family HTH domain|uniref:helix-turn-helix domain-containing protein n=1 Tax=Novosphingobium lindaniclasticum TaxID=1329895 RepID=UPI002409D297|nr:helix-turn-helix transcriptional regulator [Novosphingobium lindaniclasticum]MDF2637927.1 family transcriptional regulator [Novosphingobium lindaniclasticum]